MLYLWKNLSDPNQQSHHPDYTPWVPSYISVASVLHIGVSVPEEDVPGLAAGAGVYQLLLQVLQGAVVDVDWTLKLAAVTGALLGDLPAEADVEIGLVWFRELDSLFLTQV